MPPKLPLRIVLHPISVLDGSSLNPMLLLPVDSTFPLPLLPPGTSASALLSLVPPPSLPLGSRAPDMIFLPWIFCLVCFLGDLWYPVLRSIS